jgi:hypothetical protein
MRLSQSRRRASALWFGVADGAGKFINSPIGVLMTISSQVQPSRFITQPMPDRIPPVGAATTVVVPFVRVTGISSESGLSAISARAFGLNCPVSVVSMVAAMEPISVSPSVVSASM